VTGGFSTEMDWFEKLTGFRESPERVRADLMVAGGRLTSRVNGRSHGVGELELPSLAELRERVAAVPSPASKNSVATVVGDVRAMHRDPEYRGALFQVASQFNVLEMPSEHVTPERGVTGYAHDHTQGPACAIAAGAATIYRNYFIAVDGEIGQTQHRQVDCLREIGSALGNEGNRLWTMQNGYAMCSGEGLRAIRRALEAMSASEIDQLRAKLRIGVQWNVEVTDEVEPGSQYVSQAFCSALPVAYAGGPTEDWAAFATLVLEATYEATMSAAVLNAHRFGSSAVLLTRVGGGVFGNDPVWIQQAMRRALGIFEGRGLDVRLLCWGAPDEGHRALVEEFG
jgi:hypothetical protein